MINLGSAGRNDSAIAGNLVGQDGIAKKKDVKLAVGSLGDYPPAFAAAPVPRRSRRSFSVSGNLVHTQSAGKVRNLRLDEAYKPD